MSFAVKTLSKLYQLIQEEEKKGDTSVYPFVGSKCLIRHYLFVKISLILDVQNFPTIDHTQKLHY